MKRLKAFEGDVLARGIFPDVGIDAAPFWRDGYNTIFKGGTVRPMYGKFSLFGVFRAHPILDLHSQIVKTPPFTSLGMLFIGYDDAIYSWHEVSQPQLEYTIPGAEGAIPLGVTTGNIARTWDLTSWGNWTVAAKGLGPLLLKKGAGTSFLPITSTRSPVDGRIMVRRSPYMLVGNTSISPTCVMWCSADDIETWQPTPANSAGSYVIRDMSSDLTCGFPFLGETVWFGQNSIHAGIWVGSPNIFQFKKMLEDIGAVGPKAACSVGSKIYGIGERGIWSSDLYNYEYDDTPIIRTFLRQRLNVQQRSQICVSHDDANKLVVFSFPEVGQQLPSASITWDLDGKQWSRLTYGNTCFDTGDVFDYAVTGDSLGNAWGQRQEAEAIKGLTTHDLILKESCSLLAGYGQAGYGELGYGGNYPLGSNPLL
ncbi:MAG TPA: hypothetical protein VNS88_16395 [Nitrospiraceae bacterium]|nr:hypothetical protein [Nitrospiraceae bacterium]